MRLERFNTGESSPVKLDMVRQNIINLDGDIGYLPLSSPLIFNDGEKLALHQNTGCCCGGCMEADGKQFQPGGGTTYADTIPGGITTTATLTPGNYVASDIDTAGDTDWFGISLVAGQTYTFYTILSGSGIGDSVLTLYDSTGAQIATNDDVNATQYWSEITYTATSSGTFFLGVSAFGTDTGGYYLTSTAPATDAIPSNSTTTSTIALGGTVSGTLQTAGDHDWYAVTVVAGTSYEFTTSAVGASDVDTTLVLRDATGQVLAYNDDSAGTYSRIVYTATTSGTLYLDVGAWGNADPGTYQVTMGEPEPLTLWTLDQIANQLENGYWGGAGQARNFNVAPGGTITVNLTALTTAGQALARNALDMWTDVTGITFSEVSTGGQITFDDTEEGAFATSTRSGGFIVSSQVNVSVDWITTYGSGLTTYSLQTYVHEIGHALGLGHAGNYNGTVDIPADLLYLNDSWPVTVMSYVDQAESPHFSTLDYSRVYITTPMGADIVAIQSMYGLSTNIRTGNTTYGFNNTSGRAAFEAVTGVGPQAYAIVDNGGIDTMDYSGYTQDQVINLTQESFSNVGGRVGNVTIGRATVIENAIGGSGSDSITGNSAANTLTGGNGNDSLNGGDGNDILIGGAGTDVLTGGAGNDTFRITAVSEAPNTGITESITDFTIGADKIDLSTLGVTSHTITNVGSVYTLNAVTGSGTVRLAVTTIGGALTASDLLLTPPAAPINGTNAAETLNGTANDDTINGLAGNDTIDGGNGLDTITGGAGIDTLTGGASNDTFVYSAVSDAPNTGATESITDFTPGGDKINLTAIGVTSYSITNVGSVYTLNAVTASGTLRLNVTVTAGALTATDILGLPAAGGPINGTAAGETLNGTAGADEINGLGGDDTLNGLADADTLNGGDGNDTMNGGAGADAMTGGLGDDIYVVDVAGDTLTEVLNQGTDTVQTTLASFTLANHFENLTYTGAAAFTGTGNSLVNTITGGVGNDTLSGVNGNDVLNGGDGDDILLGGANDDTLNGGAGNDSLDGGTGTDAMAGGAGNDSYIVNLTTDTVTELNNQGTDSVSSSVTWTLGGHVENLTLTAGAAINGSGNSVANIITGNLGANTLAGLGGNDTLIGGNGNDRLIGGAGADALTGGAGNDTYQLTDALDTVTEAAAEGTDTVQAYVDYTLGANVERLFLYSGALVGVGNELANTIVGTGGANTLSGLAGNDYIYGGAGNDTISGGAGRDQLFGEAGADVFAFDDGDFGGVTSATADFIRDFSLADGDTINLSAVDAIAGGADNAFAFIGNSAFSGTAGELRFQTNASSTIVMGDTNGDGVADFWIVLTGVHALDQFDFGL